MNEWIRLFQMLSKSRGKMLVRKRKGNYSVKNTGKKKSLRKSKKKHYPKKPTMKIKDPEKTLLFLCPK